MDCEKYDKVSLDLLYDELDELTAAAARRHVAQCRRCRGIHSELQATRSVGILPLVDAPAGFEQRVVARERQVRAALPVRQKLGSVISKLAEYAMHPQFGMAALLVLIIGASLVLWNGQPQHEMAHEGSEELGRDEQEAPLEFAPRAPSKTAAPSTAPAGTQAPTLEQGLELYRAGQYDEATRVLRAVQHQGGDTAPTAALYAAQALRNKVGCAEALAELDAVATRFAELPAGAEARFRAANCRRSLGNTAEAIQDYRSIEKDPQFGQTASAALAELEKSTDAEGQPAEAVPSSNSADTPIAMRSKKSKTAPVAASSASATRPASAVRPAAAPTKVASPPAKPVAPLAEPATNQR